MFKINDYVSLVNDNVTGKVVKIVNSKIVEVEIEDGFAIEYNINELLLHSDFRDAPISSPTQNTKLQDGVVVSSQNQVLIEEPMVGIIKKETPNIIEVYLINASLENCQFILYNRNNGKFFLEFQDVLPANTAHRLLSFNTSELEKYRYLQFQILKFSNVLEKLPELLILKINIKDRCLINQHDTLPVLNQQGHLITYQSLNVVLEQKQDLPANNLIHSSIFDIHAEELLDQVKLATMKPNEILDFQLQKAKNIVNKAIQFKLQEITIIHGVGNGRLKEELIKILKEEPMIDSFIDAEYNTFGYGATKIKFAKY